MFYIICVSVLALAVGVWHIAKEEARALRVVEYTAADGGLGLKAVHLSDIHYEPGCETSVEVTGRAVAAANESAPDIAFLTGDYINLHPDPMTELGSRFLSKLRPTTYGTFASLGNHDYHHSKGREVVTAELTKAGATVLRNEMASVHHNGHDVHIIGLEDRWSSQHWAGAEEAVKSNLSKVQKGTKKNAQRIDVVILSHNPDTAPDISDWVVDSLSDSVAATVNVTILSGHTHGGQVAFPWGTPVLAWLQPLINILPLPTTRFFLKLKTRANIVRDWKLASGQHIVGAATLITSRGTGSHNAMRLNCPPEIGILHF